MSAEVGAEDPEAEFVFAEEEEEEEEDSSMEPSVRPRLTSRSQPARHLASTARLCEAVSSTREHSRGVRPGPVAGQVLGLTLSHLMMTSLK